MLEVSITELLTGDLRVNENRSANMKKACFYICPICGNIMTAVGQGSFSCCGLMMPVQEAEPDNEDHMICIETVDHEYSVAVRHPMEKGHYISLIAYVTSDSLEIVKLYPEQDVSVRFRKKGHGFFIPIVIGTGCFGRRYSP